MVPNSPLTCHGLQSESAVLKTPAPEGGLVKEALAARMNACPDTNLNLRISIFGTAF
jgi:hypothetical protein